MWLLAVYAFSKWPEIHSMETTTAEAIIKHLRQIFATHGLPRQIVSDNDPNLLPLHFKSSVNLEESSISKQPLTVPDPMEKGH